MSFAICRINKIKAYGNAGGLNDHLERKMDVPNANTELTHLNERLRGSGDLCRDIQARIEETGCKVRKNAVLAVEFMLTASPEYFAEDPKEKIELFKKKADHWIRKTYGEKNVVNITLHLDEKTPHIHAVVVPIDEKNKLNARAIFGGRDKLREMQDGFAKEMADIGLIRGMKGSKAEHLEIKKYYNLIEKINTGIKEPVTKIKLDKPGALERLNINKWIEAQENQINDKITEILESTKDYNSIGTVQLLENTIAFKERSQYAKAVEKAKHQIIENFKPQIIALDNENKVLTKKVSTLEDEIKLLKLRATNLNNKVKIFEEILRKKDLKIDYEKKIVIKDNSLDKGMKL